MFQPGGKWRQQTDTAITPDNAGERLYLRVERQTLRRLPQSGAILFGIRVHSYQMARAITTRADAVRLAEAVRALPEATVHYKSLKVYGAGAACLARRALALMLRPSASSQSRKATIFGCSAVARGQTSQ